MDRLGVRQVPEGSGEQGKMEKTGCKIIRGAPTTLAAKELMMMMTMTHFIYCFLQTILRRKATTTTITLTTVLHLTSGRRQ